MQKLTDQLKGIALDGRLPLQKALNVVAPIDEERAETVALLKKLETQVGQHHGEQIQEHLAKMDNRKFNATAYFYDKMPDSQKI